VLAAALCPGEEPGKLLIAAREFDTYLRINAAAIPNYGERYRAGETISSSPAESAVTKSSANTWSRSNKCAGPVEVTAGLSRPVRLDRGRPSVPPASSSTGLDMQVISAYRCTSAPPTRSASTALLPARVAGSVKGTGGRVTVTICPPACA
jgi:hypothetical protein